VLFCVRPAGKRERERGREGPPCGAPSVACSTPHVPVAFSEKPPDARHKPPSSSAPSTPLPPQSFKTGIAAIKNVAPYPGLELVTCVLQLDCGPPKTSPICFDKGGLDPHHPYIVARAESGIPEYNLQQVKFGWIVRDRNVNTTDGEGVQYTFAFQGPNTLPPGCAFI
jgi:hypothetical protein